MTDFPEPRINQMLAAMAAQDSGERVVPDPKPAARPVVMDVVANPEQGMTQAQLYAQFRMDMRAAGLTTYDVVEIMLGQTYEGPAVNVRDPKQATQATSMTLATHGLQSGLWRLYPVPNPIEL